MQGLSEAFQGFQAGSMTQNPESDKKIEFFVIQFELKTGPPVKSMLEKILEEKNKREYQREPYLQRGYKVGSQMAELNLKKKQEKNSL